MTKPQIVCRLNEVLAEKGVSGRKLARLADTSEVVVTRMRRNAFQMIDRNVAARVCLALGIELSDLFAIESDGQE